MLSESVALHRAMEAATERLYAQFDGARFERRSDLVVLVLPAIPIPLFNSVWVAEDSAAAAAALHDAIAEVESSGVQPSVQVRARFDRTRQVAMELGLTAAEQTPGMVVRAGELADVSAEVEIGLIAEDEIDAANEILASAFDAPLEVMQAFMASARHVEGSRWYVGRAEGTVVSTAVGYTVGKATGIANVATPSQFRGSRLWQRTHGSRCGRRHGAGLTVRVSPVQPDRTPSLSTARFPRR